MALRLITAPTAEAITLAEAKLHCRVDITDDDALINQQIAAAREQAEHLTQRAIMPQTWEITLPAFSAVCRRIRLPKAPLISVTSVLYQDANNVQQTLSPSAYVVDLDEEPGGIVLVPGQSWPGTAAVPNAVRIRYQAGYANAAAVPQGIRNWMLTFIDSLYKNRTLDAEQELKRNPSLMGLLDRYIIWSM